MAKKKHSDIPWLNVVRFHKEIVERAEESYFSLDLQQRADKRWSSLKGFEPEDDTGPWSIPAGSIVSSQFWLEYQQGEHQTVYLGGPCSFQEYEDWRGSVYPRWRPLLFREVKLEEVDGSVVITPENDTWNFAHWFFRLFSRQTQEKPLPPESYDELLEEILNETDGKASRSRQLVDYLYARYPQLKEQGELDEKPPAGSSPANPTPWVLFAPADNFAAFIQHLRQDYMSLEELLKKDESDTGGLEILEKPSRPDAPNPVDVLPFVEMNDRQAVSVERILEKWPLTVISGPPGTGKSQVVVSLLLNAWKRGLSVLFTSNNNKAVNVVHERIEKYDKLPMAVRAGTRASNNIERVLNGVLTLATSGSSPQVPTAQRKKLRTKLTKQLAELDELLAKNQLIDNDRKAVLMALGANWEYEEELEKEESEFEKQQRKFGIEDLAGKEIKALAEATLKWIESTGEHQRLGGDDEQQHESLRQKIAQEEARREKEAAKAGLTQPAGSSWDWVDLPHSAATLKTWEGKIQKTISASRSAFEPYDWKDGFERWESAEHCEEWKETAQEFIEDITSFFRKNQSEGEKTQRLKDSLDKIRVKIRKVGIDGDIDVSIETLNEWAQAYSELATRNQGSLLSNTLGRNATIKRKLKKLESELLPAYPLNITTEIGVLNKEGRGKLAPIVDLTIRWIKARNKWDASKTKRDAVLEQFRKFRGTAKKLGLKKIPRGQQAEDWRASLDECEERIPVSQQGRMAWKKRHQKEAAADKLWEAAEEFLDLLDEVPLLKAWRKKPGKTFSKSIKSLKDEPSARAMDQVKSELDAEALSPLVDAWETIEKHQANISELLEEEKEITTPELRISQWWEEKPAGGELLAGIGERPDAWPDTKALQKRIKDILDFASRREDFIAKGGGKEAIEKKAAAELTRAKEKSKNVLKHLPTGQAKTDAENIYARIWKSSRGDQGQLVRELDGVLQQFTPAAIDAQKRTLRQQLAADSFQDAKESFHQRLAKDDKAVAAVSRLLGILKSNRGSIGQEHHQVFKEALRLVPIWVTTAQSPQAIPLVPHLFDIVVIDEASQCTFTNLLPLMYRGKSLVIIGDTNQLPPIPTIRQPAEELQLAERHGIKDHLDVVRHTDNNVYDVATQALERKAGGVKMLQEHFRSHPLIIGFSNRYIYHSQLILKKNPGTDPAGLSSDAGVFRENVAGVVEPGPKGESWINPQEAAQVANLAANLVTSHPNSSIGVVTPFKAQKFKVQGLLDARGISTERILVDTAHAFQGDERDLMIFSPVVSVSAGTDANLKKRMDGAATWIENPPNVTNVALTRAREALYIVADFNYLNERAPTSILYQLAEYCRDIDELRKKGGGRVELYSWLVVEGWVPQVLHGGVEFTLRRDDGIELAILVLDTDKQPDEKKELGLRAQGKHVEWVSTRDIFETPHNVIERIKEALQ